MINRILVRWLAGAAAALMLSSAQAAEGGYRLDRFPTSKLTDQAALQSGAKLFVNYCLNCHSASSMRYNRLADIGLNAGQIVNNLMFTADKVGEPMRIAMDHRDAKEWFGANPPDLSVIARARSSTAGSGSDWLYTYLRTYYRDATRATGWNNALFPNVGMPHVLWDLQGDARGATIEEIKAVKDAGTGAVTGYVKHTVSFDPQGNRSERTEPLEGRYHHEATQVTLGQAEGGMLNQAEYDETVADLVAYLTYMSDPTAKDRQRLGVWVLLFLAAFTFIAWRLNAAFWKDVK
ncbi:MAG: cytochrome c1 [Burkholderiales bacterium]|nr:MAG: cytochrome c1 [Burkholderiales bacterium]